MEYFLYIRRHFVKILTPAQLNSMTRILSSETLCPRVSRFTFRWTRVTRALGTRLGVVQNFLQTLPRVLLLTGLFHRYVFEKFFAKQKLAFREAPGGGTPLYKLYRYVPPQRVWFLSRFGLKTGIDFNEITARKGPRTKMLLVYPLWS